MNFLRLLSVACIAVASLAARGLAAEGTTGAQLLELPPDARSVALGRTYVGIADDINCLYYNPAGLAQIANMEVPIAKQGYLEGLTQQYIGFAGTLHNVRPTNVENMGAIAATYVTLESEDIVSRDEAGAAGPVFRSKDQVLTFAYGKTIFEGPDAGSLMAGASMKFFKQELQTYATEAQGFDAGLLYKVPGKRLFAGLAAQNIGSAGKFLQEEYKMPSAVALGVSGGMFQNTLILGVDVRKPTHADTSMSTGIEYWALPAVAVRAGYNTALASAGSGFSAGMGLSLKQTDIFFMYASEICIDYAFVPYGDLGDTHRLSLLLKLGAQ